MISAWWLLLIIPATVVATFGYIAFSAYCWACKEEDNRWWEEKTLAEQERKGEGEEDE